VTRSHPRDRYRIRAPSGTPPVIRSGWVNGDRWRPPGARRQGPVPASGPDPRRAGPARRATRCAGSGLNGVGPVGALCGRSVAAVCSPREPGLLAGRRRRLAASTSPARPQCERRRNAFHTQAGSGRPAA
jgi:hypothetical protein